jgi:Na+/H+ antiporter NhaD/arsenite permease-like protein
MELVAVCVFLVTLAVIVLDWVDRTKAALAGAGIMVVAGVLGEDRAIEAVDWSTLGLLAGMMLLVSLTEQTGVFAYLALHAARLSRGRPLRLVLLLATLTGVLSAFLDNLTTVLLVVPVTLTVARTLGLPVVPLVLIEIMASNIGGTATLIGDPPNILIGTHVEELSFNDFIVNLAPVSVAALAAASGLLYAVYRRSLRVAPDRVEALRAIEPRTALEGARNLRRSVAVLAGTIVAFFLHAPLHLEPAVVALAGATVLLIVSREPVEEALARIDWATLFFFLGLFVVVGGLAEQGVLERVSGWVAAASGDSRLAEGLIVLGGAALGSALVDNIPFTTAMIPVVEGLQEGRPFDDGLWWALALGACFGGNATLIAAAANVAATGLLARQGVRVSFTRFLAVGVPVTLLSLLLAAGYLVVFQL